MFDCKRKARYRKTLFIRSLRSVDEEQIRYTQPIENWIIVGG